MRKLARDLSGQVRPVLKQQPGLIDVSETALGPDTAQYCSMPRDKALMWRSFFHEALMQPEQYAAARQRLLRECQAAVLAWQDHARLHLVVVVSPQPGEARGVITRARDQADDLALTVVELAQPAPHEALRAEAWRQALTVRADGKPGV